MSPIRLLIISDIHGCHKEFNALLRKVNCKPSEDKLILLGDYVDRGLHSKEIIEQVMRLKEEWGVIVLKGNHDKMAYDALTNEDDKLDVHWLNNGGFHTMMSYCGEDFFENDFSWNNYVKAKEYIRNKYKHHLDFLSSLSLYYETKEHIFVHAGIDPTLDDWKTQKEYDFIWIRELFYNNRITNTNNKTVVFGHTSTIHLHETADIWFSPDGDKIGIDGGCAYDMQLNCLEIDEADGYRTYFVRNGEG